MSKTLDEFFRYVLTGHLYLSEEWICCQVMYFINVIAIYCLLYLVNVIHFNSDDFMCLKNCNTFSFMLFCSQNGTNTIN